MKKIKLLTISQDDTDATSFYRAYGVFSHLERNYNVEIIPLNFGNYTKQWHIIDRADIVFMQRPHIKPALEMIMYVKFMGKPVVVDYDDDMFHIKPINPAYMAFKDQRTQNVVIDILKQSDLVLASTGKLQEVLSEYNPNVKLVRNAFNPSAYQYSKDRNRELSNLILWRGGSGHINDLNRFKDSILEFVNGKTDFKWAFLGFYPHFLPEENDHIRATMFSDVISYNRLIWNLKPRALYVPLEETTFNLCKSNCSYLEATMAGAVCIVPNWEEWRCPGTLTYDDEGQFKAMLNGLLNGDFDLKLLNKKAWNYINSGQSLDVWNEKRYRYIKDLV